MQKNITKEKFWEIYETLPEELQDAIFSGVTAEAISSACIGSGVEEKTRQVASLVGDVLLGLSQASDFKIGLELDLNLEPSQAQNIYSAINASVFEPVKLQLQEISSPSKKIKPAEGPEKKEEERMAEDHESAKEAVQTKETPEEIPPASKPEIEMVAPATAPKKTKRVPIVKISKEPPAPPKGSDSYRETF
ncbi:MAG: hypothetical protein WC926_00135 [Candidatus Paceibacterota bacterium]|jgi:hypothetical protein